MDSSRSNIGNGLCEQFLGEATTRAFPVCPFCLGARDCDVQLRIALLKRGDFVFRYVEHDDFGEPENAFLACTFWYVTALSQLNRREEARDLYGRLLACRTRLGLLAEHVDPATREPWGNFVQTYSMVGVISAAKRLSMPWDEAI